jgi:hypothetical protein
MNYYFSKKSKNVAYSLIYPFFILSLQRKKTKIDTARERCSLTGEKTTIMKEKTVGYKLIGMPYLYSNEVYFLDFKCTTEEEIRIL